MASDVHGETIQYWPLDDDQVSTSRSTPDIHKKTDSTTNIKDMGSQKIVTKCRFNINLHGIRKYHWCFYFKCAEANCNKSFNKVRDWNTHHRIIHKHKLKCESRGKKFVSPSAHRAHRNYHAPRKYTCTLCDKTFAFQSGLKQHKTVHSCSRLHCCFSGTCTKAFKWPQDLVHHIQ